MTNEQQGAFRRRDKTWELTYEGRTVCLADSMGLQDLATLLANPGRPLSAFELLDRPRRPPRRPVPTLDDRARAEYRARLRDDEMEVDRDALIAEFVRAAGTDGLPRRMDDDAERARKAARARLHDALKRISREHPSLGRHLASSISTGALCIYVPEAPVEWVLEP